MAEELDTQLQHVLVNLTEEERASVLNFAQALTQQRNLSAPSDEMLSDAEHAQILARLQRVAALSQTEGAVVSNRDHDSILYGGL